jgi:rhodanese-related sulfurtransferase
MVTRIDALRAHQMMADGTLFIDVLPETVFAQEHLPGAMSIALETMTPRSVAHLDREQPVVVYCFDQH